MKNQKALADSRAAAFLEGHKPVPAPTRKRELLPLHDRIIVERNLAVRTQLIGTLAIVTSEEPPNEGMVISVGEGRHEDGRLEPLAVKVGDCVLFGKYSGLEMEIDGRKLLVMREEEVMAILR